LVPKKVIWNLERFLEPIKLLAPYFLLCVLKEYYSGCRRLKVFPLFFISSLQLGTREKKLMEGFRGVRMEFVTYASSMLYNADHSQVPFRPKRA
jgi:hypothetical protein